MKDIVDNLKDSTVISLTATPPYDNDNELINYMSLCGDIDAKITIPQLVDSNCLCPHQDYVYFNIPTELEKKKLSEYQAKIDILINKLKNNSNFIKAIALHDYIVNTEENVEKVLEKFDFYIAMLSFLKEVKIAIPKNYFNKDLELPSFNKNMLQIILNEYVFGKHILEEEIFKSTFKDIKEELNTLGCIEEKNINLVYTKELENILLKNSGKLDSIKDIIKIEQDSLKEKLKLVVVTDFVKDDYYDVDEEKIHEVGVVPIFKKVISDNIAKAIVLTGTLIIIPTEQRETLLNIAQKEYSINPDEITIEELGINFDYSKVIFEEKHKRYAVNLITKLFKEANISVLIGTVALIGEGWDAPFINSLIMASFVSSYVTSNQVRGRAIRIDKANLEKVSNIWHLVCLENENNKYKLGRDYEIISKRFYAYEGLNTEKNKIDSGIERLNIPMKTFTKEEIVSLNENIINLAKSRENVKYAWGEALKEYVPICRENIPVYRLYKNKTGRVLKKQKGILSFTEIGLDLGICCLLINGMLSSEMIGLFLLNRAIFNKFINSEYYFVKKICKATHLAMKETNKINSDSKYFVNKSENGKIEFGLKKADTYEQMLFINSVKQAITLDQNGRYFIKSGRHIYVVPEIFSKNKNDASIFYKKLNSKGKLIYTRSESGKKILLKYKIKDFKKKFC